MGIMNKNFNIRDGMKNIISNQKKGIIVSGYCLFISTIFLLICTKSSPLYPFNDWVDSNAFFTMGKGMVNGKVLYRDLFEQKGPLLYFIHAISYLISNKTFLGVYIAEVVSFSIFLFYCYKIISLYLQRKYSFISLPLIAAIVLNLLSFCHGDSAEEFCIPLLTISLYYLINYFKNIYPNPINYKYLFLNGIVAGCVLWIKYSMLGFWFGWMMMIFISIILTKQYIRSLVSCIAFLFGMFTATIPWLIYFGVNNAIFSWFYAYVFVNIKYYSSNVSVIERLRYVLFNLNLNIERDPLFSYISIIGLVVFVISTKYIKNYIGKISLLVCVSLLALGVYGGGTGFDYYFLIFSPFIVLGVTVILSLISWKFNNLISNRAAVVIGIACLIVLLPVTLHHNRNTYMMKINKQDLVQYKFAEIINKTQNATLLNYEFLDMGFYTTTGIVPNEKFFEVQNIPYEKFPINIDEQHRYIKDKEIDYVVFRWLISDKRRLEDVPYLLENYELVKEEQQRFEGADFKFFLFRKK